MEATHKNFHLANCVAICFPIPCAAPVTNATFPSNFFMILLLPLLLKVFMNCFLYDFIMLLFYHTLKPRELPEAGKDFITY